MAEHPFVSTTDMSFEEMGVMVNEMRAAMDRHNGASLNPQTLAAAVAYLIFITIVTAETMGFDTKDAKQQPAKKWILEGVRRNLIMLERNPQIRAMIVQAVDEYRDAALALDPKKIAEEAVAQAERQADG